jgi:ABC-type transport system involved in cytochrome bd biosynthesis fused ATPase/permease subunit
MLQNTERFQNDIKKYKQIIESISNEKEKLETQKLLNDLMYEVKNMDNMYLDMVYGKQLPSMGAEMREKIISIRKKLEQKINQNQKI